MDKLFSESIETIYINNTNDTRHNGLTLTYSNRFVVVFYCEAKNSLPSNQIPQVTGCSAKYRFLLVHHFLFISTQIKASHHNPYTIILRLVGLNLNAAMNQVSLLYSLVRVLLVEYTVGVIKNCTLVFVNFSAQGASILKISVPIFKRKF